MGLRLSSQIGVKISPNSVEKSMAQLKPFPSNLSVTLHRALPQLTLQDGLLLLAVTCWGINFVVVKAAVDVLPPFVVNLVRFSIGTLLVAIILVRSGEPVLLARDQWLPMAGVAFLANVVYQALFTYGLRNTTVANNVLILSTGPLWVVVYNVLRKQERIARGGVIGVLVALSGVVLVVVSRYAGGLGLGGSTLLGDSLTLCASIAWAFNVVVTRHMMRANSVLATTFWTFAFGTFFQALVAFPDLIHLNWSLLTPGLLASLTFSGVCAIALANLAWNRGIKHIGMTRTSVYANLQPIIAASTAIVFLREPFSPWLVVGTALVLVGLWLVRRR
ncbi:MAG TPA: DMT family transporter [Aggregatilineaceae bacterium]|nr:DMT family transporter [Aggregatilineaceae bacterium]